jgi:hypothetical protein
VVRETFTVALSSSLVSYTLTVAVDVAGCGVGEVVSTVGVSEAGIVSVGVKVLVKVGVEVAVSDGVRVGGGSLVGVKVDFS